MVYVGGPSREGRQSDGPCLQTDWAEQEVWQAGELGSTLAETHLFGVPHHVKGHSGAHEVADRLAARQKVRSPHIAVRGAQCLQALWGRSRRRRRQWPTPGGADPYAV